MDIDWNDFDEEEFDSKENFGKPMNYKYADDLFKLWLDNGYTTEDLQKMGRITGRIKKNKK